MARQRNKAVRGATLGRTGRELFYPKRDTLLALESDVLWCAERCAMEIEQYNPKNEYVREWRLAKKRLADKLKELEQWTISQTKTSD